VAACLDALDESCATPVDAHHAMTSRPGREPRLFPDSLAHVIAFRILDPRFRKVRGRAEQAVQRSLLDDSTSHANALQSSANWRR